jgi:hypothetical protein
MYAGKKKRTAENAKNKSTRVSMGLRRGREDKCRRAPLDDASYELLLLWNDGVAVDSRTRCFVEL